MSKTILIKNELDGGKIEEIVINRGSVVNPKDEELLRECYDMLDTEWFMSEERAELRLRLLDRLREIEDV